MLDFERETKNSFNSQSPTKGTAISNTLKCWSYQHVSILSPQQRGLQCRYRR